MRGALSTSAYFKPLTGVRALAALLVYLVRVNPLEHSRTFWFAGYVFADFQVLGKSSYALYLIHAGLVRTWLVEPLSAPLPCFRFLVELMLTTLLAIGIYYLIEQPLNTRIRRLTIT